MGGHVEVRRQPWGPRDRTPRLPILQGCSTVLPDSHAGFVENKSIQPRKGKSKRFLCIEGTGVVKILTVA